MTRQSMLGRSLESFAEDEAQESIADLSDILRRAVLETGWSFRGPVPGEGEERSGTRRSSGWDREARGPEKSKGTAEAMGQGIRNGPRRMVRAGRRARAGKEGRRLGGGAGLRERGASPGGLRRVRAEGVPGRLGGGRAGRPRAAQPGSRSSRGEGGGGMPCGKAVEKWPVAAHRARKLEQSLSGADKQAACPGGRAGPGRRRRRRLAFCGSVMRGSCA